MPEKPPPEVEEQYIRPRPGFYIRSCRVACPDGGPWTVATLEGAMGQLLRAGVPIRATAYMTGVDLFVTWDVPADER